MQRVKILALRTKRRRSKKDERGVALITTLLLLMLLTGLTLTMAWSARSDMLINGYYRNFRGAFYAADSGLNVVRQAAINQFSPGAGLPATFTAGAAPIPAGTEATIANTINTNFSSFTAISGGSGQGQAANSWPGQFKLPTNSSFQLTPVSCTVIGTPAPAAGKPAWSCTNLPPNTTQFTYVYNYSITVQGQSKGGENATLFDRGQITLVANVVNASSKTSFAAWGMFIDTYNICDGGTLVPGTISGPVFTNGSWNFGTGKYTFTDKVGSAGPTAGYQNGGCVPVAGPSGNGIAPTFQKGFSLGQPAVPLPTNDFNQQRAVLDGKGTGGQPSPSELNNTMRDAKGNPYPNSSTKPSTGVFMPVSNASGVPTFTGGGIMVEGDANVTLIPSGAGGQTYQITQGSTTTTITIDPTPSAKFPNGTTSVSVNGSAQPTISGVPTMLDPSTGSNMGYDTMLYVDGNITGLSGPGQGSPAINDGTALTITAAKNVTLTGDLLYKSPPVTLTANGSTPADSLIPGNDHGQTLGVFTANGDIILNDKQINPKTGKFDGVMEVDASLATISASGTGGLVNPNAQITQLTIVGGRIQNNIKNINTITRNVMFDVRYANGNFSPPWFPSTSVALGGLLSANFDPPKIQRLSWQNQTPYY